MAADAFDSYLSEVNKAYLRGDAADYMHWRPLKAPAYGTIGRSEPTGEGRVLSQHW